MNYESDEDITDSSIYDLDHAPAPPPSPPSAWKGQSLSPRPPSKTRKSSTLPRGGSLGVSSSFTRDPSLSWSNLGRSSITSFSAGKSYGSAPISMTSSNSITPSRRRAYSQSSATNPSVFFSAPNLSHVRSFPPDGNEPSDRKVGFVEAEESPSQTAMLPFPEMEEVKEDEEGVFKEIAPSGTELDEVKNRHSRSDSLTSPWSDSEAHFDGEDYLGEEEGVDIEENGSVATALPRPAVLFGFELPVWFSKRRVSWNRVATFVVEKAPCFLCMRMKQGTYRSVLVRLNIICAFFAIMQLIAAIWLFAVMQNPSIVDRDIPTLTTAETEDQSNFEVLTNVWNLNGPVLCLGIFAAVLLASIALTVRVIQNVNLAGAIRFLWLLLWVIPLQVFWMIGLFDYFHVTPVWIKFWWRDRSMAWFRNRFCDPSEYANTLCAVPEFVSSDEATAWCVNNYNSNNCVEIRDAAQHNMQRSIYTFYYAYAAWTICFILVLFLVVKTLESIISRPLVQKARESNIPSWLLLPIVGCTVCGCLYSFSEISVSSTSSTTKSEASWIGPVFIAAGGMFFIAAMLAWFIRSYSILNVRDKRRKSIAVLVFLMISASLIIILTTIFSASIAFSLSLEQNPISDDHRGRIACFVDQCGSCTQCQDADIAKRCPEWSKEDVTKILQSQAKASASLAAIFLIYAADSLRYGFTMRKHISNYMIDFV